MCHLSVQFLYARKALKTGAFQAIVGESALPEERQSGCYMPEWACSTLRAEKLSFQNGLYNIVFTSNRSPSLWRENFNEEDSLLCALDRIFDDATVFNIHGESFRGKRLETYALQAGRVSGKNN